MGKLNEKQDVERMNFQDKIKELENEVNNVNEIQGINEDYKEQVLSKNSEIKHLEKQVETLTELNDELGDTVENMTNGRENDLKKIERLKKELESVRGELDSVKENYGRMRSRQSEVRLET